MPATFQDYLDQDYLAQDYLEQDYLGKLSSGGATEPDPPVATTIELLPSIFDGAPGNLVQLIATVYDQYGEVMVGEDVSFDSSDEDIATVDANGLVTLLAPGEVTITSTGPGGITDTSTGTIVADPPPVFGGGGGFTIIRAGLRSIVIHV